MNVTHEQIVAILEQRATSDRLIAEILRAAVIEAGAIAARQDIPPTVPDSDEVDDE